ncbi:MAG: hypothetical protein ACJ72V_05145 [Nitrososphaeraceae archaeon]
MLKQIPNNKANNTNNINQEENNNQTISIRLIPYIKCKYCNSEFNTDKERKENELGWHI